MWPFSRKKNNDGGGWEEHPCVLPSEPLGITHLGAVWRCYCGRRWQFVEADARDDGGARYTWREVEPDPAWSEADFRELENYANGGIV